MDKTTIKKLRKKLDNANISYGEIADIKSAFAEIPDEKLRDLRENAMASDMLDEIEDNCLHNYNDDICTTCGDVRENETDKIIKRREELMDLFTPSGNNWEELMELLELERELTLREE